MGRILPLAGVAAASLMSVACTTLDHQTARADAAATLASAPSVHAMALQETGTEAYAFGDRYTAANLFERSADKDGSVVARYNLAYAYERTGRLPEAAALYRGLVRDGQYMWGVTAVDYRNRGARLTRFNIADDSAERLAMIEQRLTYASTARSASTLGVPASAVVGGSRVVVARRISDAEAMRLDAAATP